MMVEQISANVNRAGTDDQPTRKPVTIASSTAPTVVTVRTFSMRSPRLGLLRPRWFDVAKPGHLDPFGRESPAYRHAARQRPVELDADRDDPRRARPRRRRVGELDRHDREDRAGAVGQIRQRLAVEHSVWIDRSHRPLVHVAVIPVDQRLLAVEPREDHPSARSRWSTGITAT